MGHARTTFLIPILTAALAAAVVLLIPRRASDPPRKLAQPDYLDQTARAEIHRHMNRHGTDMIELSWDVVLLDDDATAACAERVAREPALAPGVNGLSRRFYALDDEMLAAAVNLGQAARSHDGAAISQAYGRLATTCVACHRLYLRR